MRRRFTWRNERSLYYRKCALTGKNIMSCFAPEAPVTVYDRDVWDSFAGLVFPLSKEKTEGIGGMWIDQAHDDGSYINFDTLRSSEIPEDIQRVGGMIF